MIVPVKKAQKKNVHQKTTMWHRSFRQLCRRMKSRHVPQTARCVYSPRLPHCHSVRVHPPQVSTAVLRRRQRRHLVCPRSCFPFLPLNWLNWKSLSVSHVSINFSLRKIHVPIRIPSYINFTFFANTCNSDMLRILKSYRAMLTNPQQEDSIKKDNRWRRSRVV